MKVSTSFSPSPAHIKYDVPSNLALRLFPSAPINIRTSLKTTILPRGGGPDGLSPVLIRRGMGIGYSIYHMHRRRDLYGDDAALFRPERWEDGKLANIGWGYLPFNGGPRTCLGSECCPNAMTPSSQ